MAGRGDEGQRENILKGERGIDGENILNSYLLSIIWCRSIANDVVLMIFFLNTADTGQRAQRPRCGAEE